MKWRPVHNTRLILVVLAAIAVIAQLVAENVQSRKPQRYQVEKLAAAQRMANAIRVIADYRRQSGHEFAPETDPRQTGLIGLPVTQITSDRGALPVKQIVTNPNFAALVVHMFRQAQLSKGDTIAVAWTGSLPGANLAVLSAAETLGLKVVAIHSVAASMYGANDPDFAWLDMEKLLVDKGVFRTRSVAATMGGDEDRGKGLGSDSRSLIEEIASRTGVPLMREPDFPGQLARREKLYAKYGKPKIKLYVNVGGGIASLGSRINNQIMPQGLSQGTWGKAWGRDGVMTLMAKRGVPIVHISVIDRLCRRYGFPPDPDADPTPGTGPMFHRDQHNIYLVGGCLAGLLVLLVVGIRIDARRYLRLRAQRYLLPSGRAGSGKEASAQ